MPTLEAPQMIRKKKAPVPPKYDGLAIPSCHGPLSKANSKAVCAYHEAGRKFDAALAELFDRHATLMEKGPTMPFRDIRKVGDELVAERNRLLNVLIDLRWQRFALVPNLVADFEAAAVAYKAAHEQGFNEAAKRFAKEGITARSMPSGEVNLRTAEMQLRKRLESEVEVLKTVAPMRDAEGALSAIKSTCTAVPRWTRTFIRWPAPSGEYGHEIATVARLDRSYPLPSLSGSFQNVVQELGFENSPLTQPMRDSISELAAKCDAIPGNARPVRNALTVARNRAHLMSIVSELPRTPEISEMLGVVKAQGF